MKIKLISVVLVVILLGSGRTPAEATPAFGISQNPAVGSVFNMRSTQTLTYTITNSNTAGSTDRIYRVRFRLNCSGTCTAFSAATAAPANWTKTTSTTATTTVEFRANAWAYAIPPTGTLNFPVVFTMGSMAADTTQTLRDARARFTTTSNFCYSGCAPLVNAVTSNTVTLPTGSGGTCAVMTSAGTPAVSTCVSWTLKALAMTLVPSTFNVGTGCTFTLTMSVTNNSTAAVTVTSVTKPPTPTGVSVSTSSNPANLSLAVLGSGTMVWNYTAGGSAGTVNFTACASAGASCATVSGTSITSSTVITPNITVSTGLSCNFTATLDTPTCLFSGDTATFTMTVTNTTGGTVNNVVPSALTRFTTGAAVIGAFTGPAPASYASIANNTSQQFTWTAPVTGNLNDTYYVTGNATATGYTSATATSNTTEDIEEYGITVSPSSTNTNSANQELTWTITNTGCADVNQVRVTVPAGWTVPVADSYSLIGQVNPPNPGAIPIENVWTVAGTNPVTTDAVSTAVMGYDPQAKRGTKPFATCDNTMLLAEAHGIGTTDLSRIDVRGVSIADARFRFAV